MRRRGAYVLASLLFLLIASLAWAQPGIVMGTVTDTSGVGIDSAYVTLSRGCMGGGGGGQVLYSTYTGADGSYLFPAVTPNNYKIKARKMGYGMAMQNITVTAGGTLVVNLTLSGCGGGGGGGGCPHDTLEVVDAEGYAIVDTAGMCQDLYYLDTDNNGEPDYRLNFGPPGYEPGSGATRPADGDFITISGGLVTMPDPDMIIVYEINGLWWRDPMYPGGGGWHHGGGHRDVAKAEIGGISPNPFNPETAVNFILPETGFANLSVYNLRGQLVAELVNDVLESGAHQVTWNPGALASGIYLFRLEAGNAVSLKRAVFVK